MRLKESESARSILEIVKMASETATYLPQFYEQVSEELNKVLPYRQVEGSFNAPRYANHKSTEQQRTEELIVDLNDAMEKFSSVTARFPTRAILVKGSNGLFLYNS